MLDSSSGGFILKLGTVLGHGWVERGSSQVILSTKQSSDLSWIVNVGYLSVQVQPLTELQFTGMNP